MINELKKFFAKRRLGDEALYALVANEIESGIRRNGLWAMALSDSNFDETEAKARYIKLRVQSIKDELELVGERAGRDIDIVPLEEGVYANKILKLAKRIGLGKGDISDYINLCRALNYECNQNGVFNTTFDVRVGNLVIKFKNDDSFKIWVKSKLVSPILAGEEIAL